MNLSFNDLRRYVPNLSSQLQLSLLDLSSNSFNSPLPGFSANLRVFVLDAISFFGTISHQCAILSVNNNLLFGSIRK